MIPQQNPRLWSYLLGLDLASLLSNERQCKILEYTCRLHYIFSVILRQGILLNWKMEKIFFFFFKSALGQKYKSLKCMRWRSRFVDSCIQMYKASGAPTKQFFICVRKNKSSLILSNHTSVSISSGLTFFQKDRMSNRESLALSHDIKQHIYQRFCSMCSQTNTLEEFTIIKQKVLKQCEPWRWLRSI